MKLNTCNNINTGQIVEQNQEHPDVNCTKKYYIITIKYANYECFPDTNLFITYSTRHVIHLRMHVNAKR